MCRLQNCFLVNNGLKPVLMMMPETCKSIQGEVCVAGSRVYVQEGIYDEFVKKTVEAAQSWKVGDPFDVTTNMGPQV